MPTVMDDVAHVVDSFVVEHGTIVTAVVRSSGKVGGSETQFARVESLARSKHQQTCISYRAGSLLRGEEKKFQNLITRRRDYDSTSRTQYARGTVAGAMSERALLPFGSSINFKALEQLLCVVS